MNTEKKEETPKESILTTMKATSTIPDWDHDVQVIPRLQVVDEHQKFT